jgi:hypothetical protein
VGHTKVYEKQALVQVKRGLAENGFMADKWVALAKAIQTRMSELFRMRVVPIFSI